MHIQGEKGKLYMCQAYGGYSEDILIGFFFKQMFLGPNTLSLQCAQYIISVSKSLSSEITTKGIVWWWNCGSHLFHYHCWWKSDESHFQLDIIFAFLIHSFSCECSATSLLCHVLLQWLPLRVISNCGALTLQTLPLTSRVVNIMDRLFLIQTMTFP